MIDEALKDLLPYDTRKKIYAIARLISAAVTILLAGLTAFFASAGMEQPSIYVGISAAFSAVNAAVFSLAKANTYEEEGE